MYCNKCTTYQKPPCRKCRHKMALYQRRVKKGFYRSSAKIRVYTRTRYKLINGKAWKITEQKLSHPYGFNSPNAFRIFKTIEYLKDGVWELATKPAMTLKTH